MKKIMTVIVASVLFSACTLPFGKSQKSALDVKSDPPAKVYINDDHVGTTPYYKDDLKPGVYTVKLSVENQPEIEWQTQVELKPQLLTNVTRFFGKSEDVSSHYTLSLEKNNQKDTGSIVVISLPDSAVVKRDGQPMGFAPVEMNSLQVGDYQITLSSPGYKQLVIPIKAIAQHTLTISAKLGKDKDIIQEIPTALESSPSAQINASPTPSLQANTNKATASATLKPPYATVLETPTGWLRVRSEPSGITDNEVARVVVGKSFPIIKNNNAGWYQIEYETGKFGWISAQYAKLTE